MATTKPKTTAPVKKRRKPTGKPVGKRKTGKRRKKGMLSELVSKQSAMRSAKSFGGGAIGGAALGISDALMGDNTNQILQFGVAVGLAWVSGGMLNMPNVAAGVGGAYGYKITRQLEEKLLSEMEAEEYADEDSLEEYPDALDENGTPMFLAEDGNFYYLEEFELAEGSFQANDMYPAYVNSSRF